MVVTGGCPQQIELTATPTSVPLRLSFQAIVQGVSGPWAVAGPYQSDLGDGSTAQTTTIPSTSHTYQSPGAYTATVTAPVPPGCPATPGTATVTAASAGSA
jgi:PKD repeat protein